MGKVKAIKNFTKMKLVTVVLMVLIVQGAYCDDWSWSHLWHHVGKPVLNAGLKYGALLLGDEAELAERKSVANEVLDELFNSIGKSATFKMVNDMKEILDQKEADNSDNDFDENVEDANQAEQDTTDVDDESNDDDKLDEKTLKLLELLEDSMNHNM